MTRARSSSTVAVMVSDFDIYRSAKLLVDQHGEDAATHAAMEADKLMAKGDMEGAATWKRVIAAIEELQRTKPEPGESRH